MHEKQNSVVRQDTKRQKVFFIPIAQNTHLILLSLLDCLLYFCLEYLHLMQATASEDNKRRVK